MRVINITRCDGDALDKMIQFLYREDYSFDPADSMAAIGTPDDEAAMALSILKLSDTNAGGVVDRLAIHVGVYSLARHYGLPDLEGLTNTKFTADGNAHGLLSADELIGIAAVVYNEPATVSSEMRHQVVSAALVRYQQYLAQPVFRQAIIEREDLRQFSVSFLAGISSYQETEIAHVVQDFQSEYQKCQSELSDAVSGRKLADAESKAHKSALEHARLENRKLDQELIGQKYASEANLTEMERRHKKTAQELISERNKVQADLQAWRQSKDSAEAKQKLQRTNVAALELQIKNLEATITSLRSQMDISEARPLQKVIDQLVEFSRIPRCRSCDTRFYYILERRGPTGYLARCFECKARHYAGDNNGVI